MPALLTKDADQDFAQVTRAASYRMITDDPNAHRLTCPSKSASSGSYVDTHLSL